MTTDKERLKSWIIRVLLIIITAIFLLGFLLPLLISGGTFSLLIGIGCGLIFIVVVVFEAFELFAELNEILRKQK